MKKQSLISLLCLVGMLASCGGTAAQQGETTASDTTDAVTEESYQFPEADLKGDTFTILNTDQTYSFYGNLDFEEESGDALDDSIYLRNRKMEERYNFKLEIINDYALDAAAKQLQTVVLAGDDVYDVAFLRDYYMSTVITEGYLMNLDEIPELQIDKKWWDTAVTEDSRIGKSQKAFFAMTDVSLVDFEGTMVTFFNEDMMNDLGLDLPYQLVLDGKWTFDALVKYMKAGANLNGDESWTFNENGKCIYGLATYQHGTSALISGANINYIQRSDDGTPEVGLKGDKFYTYFAKIKDAYSVEGEYIYANNGGANHYEEIFKQNRALMIMSQLKAANKYRDFTSTYGILPIAKMDEAQENYRCVRTFSYLMMIPITNQIPHETGIIMDAMSYLTYKDIMPYFYQGRVSQKLLRTDDSIKMLELIRDSRHFEFGTPYGWFNSLLDVTYKAANGSGEIASALATTIPTIEASIEKVLTAIDAN